MTLRRLRRLGRRSVAVIAVVAVVVVIAVIALLNSTDPIRHTAQFVAGTPEGAAPVQLDTTLYYPAHTPAPAVLLAHGFGGSKSDLASEATTLARHGYVVLAYTARGFGRSGGLVHLDAPSYEVADASKLVSYLATLPQVIKDAPADPRVAVAGSSYGGGLALLLAGTDKRVDAVGADITWNNLTTALFPNGADTTPGVFKKLWAGYLFEGATGAGGCGRFAPDICAAYQQAAQTGVAGPQITALLQASSPSSVLRSITAPTLLTQGEQDSLFPLDQADANARGIAATGTKVKVVWRSGGHDAPSDTADITGPLLSWLDATLRGEGAPSTSFDISETGSAISSETGRAVDQILRVETGYPGVATPVRTVPVTLAGPPQPIDAPAGGNPAAVSTLSALGGLLSTAASLGATGATSLTTIPGQVAGFESAPITGHLLIAGDSTIALRVTPRTTTDATLFVSLADVSTDGSSAVPNALVAPVRLTGLTPGQPRTVTVRLPGIVHDFAAGHRVRLTVATTDLGYQLPTDPRSYSVALAGTALSVPTVTGTVVRAGHPLTWLIVGVIVAAVVLLAGVALAIRRRVTATGDPDLADTPIAIRDLVKTYGDGYRAVDGITFSVLRGQVVGLLGPNGAGKTTTLRMLVGLIRPTSGAAYVFGEPIRPGAAVLARVGAFIEGPGFLPHLSGRENLQLYWAATGRPEADAEFDTALDIAGLGASVDRRVKTFSQGMRQRLAIAQAMLGLPELLVLDEPTNGLDPPQIAEMREVLQSYARTGRTVVISSHLLGEVEETCTHVVVMHRGRLIAAGSVAEIAGAGGVQLVVDDPARATDVLAAAGIRAESVPGRRALEDVFLEMVHE
jgi:ABC-2 type transport system ATP-binding protein